jgi:hypothetical protein
MSTANTGLLQAQVAAARAAADASHGQAVAARAAADALQVSWAGASTGGRADQPRPVCFPTCVPAACSKTAWKAGPCAVPDPPAARLRAEPQSQLQLQRVAHEAELLSMREASVPREEYAALHAQLQASRGRLRSPHVQLAAALGDSGVWVQRF